MLKKFPSDKVNGTKNALFSSIFIKVYIFVPQNAWTL